jgi:hypothetical protein
MAWAESPWRLGATPRAQSRVAGRANQLPDQPADQCDQRLFAATKAGDGHCLRIDPLQRERMSGLFGERRHKRQLRPAVAFAERWMAFNSARKCAALSAKASASNPERFFCFARLAKSRPISRSKFSGSRRNFRPHRPQSPGPGVHVLEQVPVNGAQVAAIEFSGWQGLGEPLRGRFSLKEIQVRLGAQVRPVLEDGRPRIAIRV